MYRPHHQAPKHGHQNGTRGTEVIRRRMCHLTLTSWVTDILNTNDLNLLSKVCYGILLDGLLITTAMGRRFGYNSGKRLST